MRELSDDECRAIAGKACLGCDLIRAGYAAGYAAAIERLRAERDAARSMATYAMSMQWKAESAERSHAECVSALIAERDTLAAIVRAIARDPHGCPFCDSGKLRQPYDPSKGHDANCGYLLMDAARAKWEERHDIR